MWDDVASLQELGFSLQPSKGTIEPGQKHTVSITWTPNRGYKVGNKAALITVVGVHVEVQKKMVNLCVCVCVSAL